MKRKYGQQIWANAILRIGFWFGFDFNLILILIRLTSYTTVITRKLRNRMTQFITLNSLMKVEHSNCAVQTETFHQISGLISV